MAKAIKRQCSTCEHYGAPRGQRLYYDHVYRCRWTLPPIEWPTSLQGREPKPEPHHMAPSGGKTCQQWTAQT